MYFNRCEALVEEAQAAHAELTHQAQNPGGVIRASLPVDFAADRITTLIANFLKLYPQVQFDLDLSPRQSDLIAEPVDFVIRIGRSAGSGLIQRKLTDVPIGLFASPDYLAKFERPKQPRDLADHRVLSILGRSLHFTPVDGGPMVEFRPQAPVLMNNVSWLKRFALAGLGIAALSPNTLRTELATGELVGVLTDWQLPSVEVFVLTESRLLPARVRLFLDYLIQHIDAKESTIHE
jgi:DNA-binding transcriptional LysR family regulator